MARENAAEWFQEGPLASQPKFSLHAYSFTLVLDRESD